MPDPYAEYTLRKRAWYPQRRWIPIPIPLVARKRNYQPDALEFLQKYDNEIPERDYQLRNRQLSLEEIIELYPEVKWLSDLNLTPAEIEMLISPENYDKLVKLMNRFDRQMDRGTYDVEDLLKQQLDAEKELEDLQNQARRDEPAVFGNKMFRQGEKRFRVDTVGEDGENEQKPKFYAEGGVVGTDLVDGKGEIHHHPPSPSLS